MSQKTKMKFHVLAIFCILIFCFALTPVTFQNDTYYSITIGKHIIETGNIDMQDPFSWHEDLPYTYPHWGYDVATYLVYQLGENIGIGGFAAIYIATILLAMILGVLIYYILNKLCKNPLVSFFIAMVIMYLLKDFITARAQLVTYILFALTILFIEQFIQTKKKRYAVYLVIIPILLANLHCAVWPFYFVLFLPYIGEYILALTCDTKIYYWFAIKRNKSKLGKLSKKGEKDAIEKQEEKLAQLQLDKEKSEENTKKRRERPYKVIFEKKPAVKWLIIIMIICIFTGLLTPLGEVPYTYLVKTMQGNTTQNISEHQPLVLINNRAMLITFIVYILLLIFTDTKASLSDFFMIGGLTILSLMSRRQTALFAIMGGFVFAKLIAALIEKYDKKGTKAVVEFATTILGRIFTVLIVILLSILLYRGKEKDHFVNERSYPIEASNFILENLDINNIRLFNEYNYGSYLLYRGIPVFIDSRADLYAPEFNGTKNEEGKWEGRDIFSDYINVSNISTYYEDKMVKYDITHVIIGKNTKLNMFLSREDKYIELYSDDYFVVYERIIDN
ncbi:MAG: hypothetical protein HFJ32_03700 [Clostridia bacterium]|nr:hypothetical protein [Clostridia bacterium]